MITYTTLAEETEIIETIGRRWSSGFRSHELNRSVVHKRGRVVARPLYYLFKIS